MIEYELEEEEILHTIRINISKEIEAKIERQLQQIRDEEALSRQKIEAERERKRQKEELAKMIQKEIEQIAKVVEAMEEMKIKRKRNDLEAFLQERILGYLCTSWLV